MGRLSVVVAGLLLSAFTFGCASRPPLPPEPPQPLIEDSAIAVAASPDPSALRSAAERQRESLTRLFDVAERRELRENGPPVLREMKEASRELDRIQARIDEIDRNVMGPARDDELSLVQLDLRRLQTRVLLLEDTLR